MKRIILLSAAICFSAFAFSQGKVVFQNPDGTNMPDTIAIVYQYGIEHLTFEGNITNIDTVNGYKIRLKRIVKQAVPDATDMLCIGIFCNEFSASQVEEMTAGGDSIYKDSKVSTTVPWELIAFTPDSTDGMAIYQYFIISETNQNGVFINQDSIMVMYDLTGVGIDDTESLTNAVFNLFPNPASEKVTIHFSYSGKLVTLSIKNILGKSIKTIPLANADSTFDIPIDDWKSGLYFLSIETDGKSIVSKKLIKY
jgi:hypothetical protein